MRDRRSDLCGAVYPERAVTCSRKRGHARVQSPRSGEMFDHADRGRGLLWNGDVPRDADESLILQTIRPRAQR